MQFVVGLNLIKGGAKAPRVLGGGIYETHFLVNCTYTWLHLHYLHVVSITPTFLVIMVDIRLRALRLHACVWRQSMWSLRWMVHVVSKTTLIYVQLSCLWWIGCLFTHAYYLGLNSDHKNFQLCSVVFIETRMKDDLVSCCCVNNTKRTLNSTLSVDGKLGWISLTWVVYNVFLVKIRLTLVQDLGSSPMSSWRLPGQHLTKIKIK